MPPAQKDRAAPREADNHVFQPIGNKPQYDSSSDSSSQNSWSSEEESSGSTGCASPDIVRTVTKQKRRLKREITSHPYQRCSRESSPESVTGLSSHIDQIEINDSTDSSLVRAMELVDGWKSRIVKILDMNEYQELECHSDAKRLSNVAIVMVKSLQLANFLAIFGHSVSCRNTQCSTSCKMLRRVRSHVMSAKHSCALMHLYGQILRLHVDTCHKDDGACGMQSCKGMRDTRRAQNTQVLPREYCAVEQLVSKTLAERFPGSKSGPGIITEKVSLVPKPVGKEASATAETALDLSKKGHEATVVPNSAQQIVAPAHS